MNSNYFITNARAIGTLTGTVFRARVGRQPRRYPEIVPTVTGYEYCVSRQDSLPNSLAIEDVSVSSSSPGIRNGKSVVSCWVKGAQWELIDGESSYHQTWAAIGIPSAIPPTDEGGGQ